MNDPTASLVAPRTIPLVASAVPVIPLSRALERHAMIGAIPSFDRLAALFRDVALREPPVDDATRWHAHRIDGRDHRFAQPLTFTPYASTRACSARCLFCSENLRDDTAGPAVASMLRPRDDYFATLAAALRALGGVPLSYSLSGLENTDDPDWLIELLHTLRTTPGGPRADGAVLYTNGAGLVDDADTLLPALEAFGLSWVEWSRHHDDAQVNQRLMRFRDGRRIATQAAFHQAVRRTVDRLPVKLVCIVQRGGIETPADVARYVAQARTWGVSAVIFREFSELPTHYRPNATRRYIDAARTPVDALLDACLDDAAFRRQCTPLALTGGYYFWNARWQRDDGLEIVFEKSDYRAMRAREDSGLVYKLVFHANGHLCAGWQPDRHVLWRPHADQ